MPHKKGKKRARKVEIVRLEGSNIVEIGLWDGARWKGLLTWQPAPDSSLPDNDEYTLEGKELFLNSRRTGIDLRISLP